MSPSRPALFSSLAQAVIRWSAARTSSGGKLAAHQRGVAGVLGPPLHPARSFAAASRRSFAFSGGGLHHRQSDRGRAKPAGGQPGAARSSTFCSAARAPASIEQGRWRGR